MDATVNKIRQSLFMVSYLLILSWKRWQSFMLSDILNLVNIGIWIGDGKQVVWKKGVNDNGILEGK